MPCNTPVKLSGRCIAGKEIWEEGRVGDWIRPVSARDRQEVSEWERQYEDGSDPLCSIDVIDVADCRYNAQPKDYQRENMASLDLRILTGKRFAVSLRE